MGIVIMGIVLAIISYLLFRWDWSDFTEFIGAGCAIFSITCGMIVIVMLIIVNINNKNMIIEYNINQDYYNSIIDRKDITDYERTKINYIILETNKKIEISKQWRDNFFIGWFIENDIGDKKPFDFDKIPVNKYNIRLNNSTKINGD